MNSYFLLTKYAAVKMEQGIHLGTNEEVGLLCSNSWWDFSSFTNTIHTHQSLELGSILLWTGRSQEHGLSFLGCTKKAEPGVRGNCCILFADGDCIFAWHLLPLSYPTRLLAEPCSVIAGQIMYLRSWLTHASTRTHSNLVSFLPLKVLFSSSSKSLPETLPLPEQEGRITRGDTLPVLMCYSLFQVCSPRVEQSEKVN